jgi:hypothetical protein
MVAFIDEHREAYGVEPICSVLPIAPSTYHEQKARERDPSRLPDRVDRDKELLPEIERYGSRTAASTARGRCGVSCTGRTSRWPGARSSG